MAAITNYYKLSGVKQYPFIISWLCGSEVWEQHHLATHTAWSLTRPIARYWQSCVPIWRLWARIHLRAHSDCWLALIPCRCRTVSISLLAVRRADFCSQLLRPILSCFSPSLPPTSMGGSMGGVSHAFESLLFHFPPYLFNSCAFSFCFKGLM